MKARYLASCALVAISTGLAGGAFADDVDAGASAPNTGIQEIVVTAQRRDQTIQTVPMTIQAFTATALTEMHISTIDDLLRFTPNVEFAKNGPGQGSIFMRGLSAGFAGNQSSSTVGNFPNVGLYLDDQSMQFPWRNVDLFLADIERVEVLEGPQGTLFGGGAEAGAVRYITNKPKLDEWEAKVDATYGFQSHGDANTSLTAVINAPIIKDKLAVRAVIYDDRQGGYINNVPSTFTRSNVDSNAYFGIKPTNGVCPNGLPPGPQTGGCTFANTHQVDNASVAQKDWNPVTHQGLRVSALYEINPDWNVLIAESLQHLDAEGLAVTYPVGSDFQKLNKYEVTSFVPAYDKDDFQNTAWTINGKAGPLKLIYTGGYQQRRIQQQSDYTNYSRTLYGQYYECTGGGAGFLGKGPLTCNSPVTYWHDKTQNTHWQHEFRASTPDTWRLRGLAGVFYEDFKIRDTMDFNYKTIPSCREGDNLAVSLAGGPTCLGNAEPYPGSTVNEPGVRPDGTGFGEQVQRGYTQIAGFGSVDFDILPNLTATAGTRYYHYSEDETGSVYSTNSGCVSVLACGHNTNIDAENLHTTYSGFKSHLGLTWKPDTSTLVYATFSQGFRPGGFSRSARDKAPDANGVPQYKTPLAYAPDSLTNYEIGFKKDFFEHRLQLNVSGYYMNWDNVQIALYQPCCLGNTTFLVNGSNYNIKGVEAQFVARPAAGWNVQGSITYNDNKQSNSPCLIANEPNSPTLGKCITEISGKPFVNPFGVEGGVSAYSPKVQANMRVRYDWEYAEYRPFASFDASYMGEQFTEPANYTSGYDPSQAPVPTTTYLRYRLAPYALFGAAIGVKKDKYQVQLIASNLLNSYASTYTSSAQFIKEEVPVRPRTISINVSAAF